MNQSNLCPGTFTANGSTWKVTTDCAFVVLYDDPAQSHIGPIEQWHPEIQRMARMHHEAYEYGHCINVGKGSK